MSTGHGMMGCNAFATTLADYLEGDLADDARDAMDAHAGRCGECAALLADLGEIRAEAAALPALAPSRDLWAGIAERIPARVLPMDGTSPARARRLAMWRHPAVASAALVLIAAGVSHLWTRQLYERPAAVVATAAPASRDSAAPAPVDGSAGGGQLARAGDGGPSADPRAVLPGARPADDSRGVGTEPAAGPRMRLAPGGGRAAMPSSARLVSQPGSANAIMRTDAEPVYDREISRLRAIVRERRAQLDPATVAVLERSIAVIDSAIAQSRAALARDSASAFLATQLNRSLEKKVELLRLTAQLPART